MSNALYVTTVKLFYQPHLLPEVRFFIGMRVLFSINQGVDGNAYCATCEEDLFYEKCKGCNKGIRSPCYSYVTYSELNSWFTGIKSGCVEVSDGEMWHTTCFVCSKCHKPLDDFVEYQNKYFCAVTCDPYSAACAACSLPMGR